MKARKLQSNSLYTGVVSDVLNTTQTLRVKLTETEQPINCIYAGNVMSSLLGFSTTFLPEIGTKVVIVYLEDDYSYIMGCLPEKINSSTTNQGMPQKTADGPSVPSNKQNTVRDSDRDVVFTQHRPSSDILEGELEFKNIKGVALSLLQNLAKMEAGDLAKVECFLMDDMVRIISDKFKHYTAFGDFEIYNDEGNLNVRWLGTNKEYETYDKTTSIEPKKDFNPANSEVSSDDSNPWKDTGRWRFHNYIGSLGNFVNFFVSDPVQAITTELLPETAASGRFKTHVNEDGSFLLQSVSDIVLERVVKIPVPFEHKRYDDESEGLGIPDPFPLNYDRWIPNDSTSLFEATYQLRDYVRWLDHYYSLASFHLDDNYTVPSYNQTKLPQPNNASFEKTGSDPFFQNYYFRYSTIRIFRDGSIVVMDADGSSINMSNRDVTISAARNLNFEAANHITFTSGNDMYLNARRHIEMSAIVGGVTMRCKSWFKTICEKGSVFFQTNVVTGEAAESSGNAEGAAEEVSPEIVDESGIVFKNEFSKTKMLSGSFAFVSKFGDFLVQCLNFKINKKLKFQIDNLLSLDFSDLKLKGNIVAAAGYLKNGIPGWGFIPPFSPPTPLVPVTPTFDLTTQTYSTGLQSVSQKNEAITEETIQEDFEYSQTNYSQITEYESITQQQIRLSESLEYSTVNFTTDFQLINTGSVTYPYPGKSAFIKAYQPRNLESLDSKKKPRTIDGTENQANIFTKQINFNYLDLTRQPDV